ncbi:MAG: AraC family transcriptional regulator [Ruminococcaceae bacterium]|nr:AraC family transcriptional regulator [Oscillospiraceae bacterium]
MIKDIPFKKSESGASLTPLFVGIEQCAPAHRYGPHVRQHYLLHFCLSGCGTLWDKRGTHRVGAGELFVIRPDEVTVYEADERDPWCYCWIGFEGSSAAVFDTAPSVLAVQDELHKRLAHAIKAEEDAPELYLALLYELIYTLFRKSNQKENKSDLQEICRYIRYNYMKDLRVETLAATFGFERSYLYRLFKQKLGVGVKEYVTAVRMERAQKFLKSGHSVAATAHMVGYADEFNFSHSFKKRFGLSPAAFAKK